MHQMLSYKQSLLVHVQPVPSPIHHIFLYHQSDAYLDLAVFFQSLLIYYLPLQSFLLVQLILVHH